MLAIEEPTLEEVSNATSLAVTDNRPGPPFSALGIRL
jgi:hypothetical protein